MDNEMIKRISKAIIETPNASDYEILVAKRAIKAMREPTEKMCIEGAMTLPDHDPSADDARDCWKNMIDAILGT